MKKQFFSVLVVDKRTGKTHTLTASDHKKYLGFVAKHVSAPNVREMTQTTIILDHDPNQHSLFNQTDELYRPK